VLVDEPAAAGEPEETTDPAGPSGLGRGLDTAIGATARVVRATGNAAAAGERVAKVVGGGRVGRFAIGAAKALTEPLAREGQAVREQVGEGLPVAARDLSQRAVPAVVDIIDPQLLLESIDLNALLAHVDLNALLAEVDLDALLERIDLDTVLDRVDIDGIVSKVDIDALISRVDIAAMISRVDIDALMGSTELGGIIAKSTSGILTQALDAIRRQGVGLDNAIDRIANRVMRRDGSDLPKGPRLLVGSEARLALAAPVDDRVIEQLQAAAATAAAVAAEGAGGSTASDESLATVPAKPEPEVPA
jgi:hypothetical protein